MEKYSALPDAESELTDFERGVFLFVLESWPVSALDVAEHLNAFG